MHTSTVVALLALIALALGQTIVNNQDAQYSGSSGGVGCGHKSEYFLRVAVFEGLVFSFPTTGLVAAEIESVKFKFNPAECYRPGVVYFNIYSSLSTYKFNESACQTNVDANIGTIRLSSTCAQLGDVDVTSQVIAAINSNNDQVAFSMSGGLDDGVDFNTCQFQQDGSLGCGAKVNGHDKSPASLSLQVTLKSQGSTAAPSTSSPSSSSAPSTAAPTTIAPSTAPSTAAPSTNAPSSSSASPSSTSAPSTAAPSTASPSTSTKAPSSSAAPQTSTSSSTTSKVPTSTPINLAGDNNARASSATTNAVSFGFLVAFVFAVVCLF
jgi:hypothetical protein